MATDESGLLYMRSRYYSPALHQFLSADSYMGDLYHPLSLNPYSYVEGNPVRYIDPMGYWATPFGDYQAHYRQPQDPQQYLQIPDNQIHYETKHTFHSLKHTPQNRRILRRQFHQSLYDTYPVCEQIRTNSRDFTHGLVASADNNLAFGAGQWIAAGKTRPNLLFEPNTTAYYAGKTTGDAFFTVYGVIEIVSGISISGTGAVMSSTGVGAVAGAPMAIEGVALAGHGTLVASVSLVNMQSDFDAMKQAGRDDEELKNIYNSIKESPNYPEGFKPRKNNGTTKNKMDNSKLLHKLQKVEPGEWRKVYKDGFDSFGNKISIHYFESKSGKVFDVKVVGKWSNK